MGSTFNPLKIDRKVGVDPNSPLIGVLQMTSDKFFKTNTEKFDLILVDGDHSYTQSLRDIKNSLKFINDNGLVLVHDVKPKCDHERFGEVYKSVKCFSPIDYLDVDDGMAVLRKDCTYTKPKGLLFKEIKDYIKRVIK